MMKPILSIIIVNYNTTKLTKECIQSVIDSKPKVGYEIIVVDNGSEEPIQILNIKHQNDPVKISSKLNVAGKLNIIFIKNKENKGFAKAVNQGIDIAEGRYILLLNSDTEVKGDAIDQIVEYAIKTPDAGVVGVKLLNVDGSVQPSCFNFPTIKNTILASWFNQNKLLEKFAPPGQKHTNVDAIVGAVFLITPAALKKVGLFDERYFMYYEDLDYCRRVKNAGLKVYYLPEAEVVHYHGQSGKNIAGWDNQWRRLIPSSKIYHGIIKHYFIFFIMWTAQKWQKIFGN